MEMPSRIDNVCMYVRLHLSRLLVKIISVFLNALIQSGETLIITELVLVVAHGPLEEYKHMEKIKLGYVLLTAQILLLE